MYMVLWHSLDFVVFPMQLRFQYEEYPAETKQAWRQVVLIQHVEIRDRLSSSQINKLLYQYSTEARPKQTHSNMVRQCAIYSIYNHFGNALRIQMMRSASTKIALELQGASTR